MAALKHKTVPSQWRLIHQKSLGSLIRLETKTLGDLRSVVRQVTAELSDAISGIPEDRVRVDSIRYVRRFAEELQNRFYRVLLDNKTSTRRASRKKLSEELDQLQAELNLNGIAAEVLDPRGLQSSEHDDAVDAASAAASFRAAWTAYVMYLIHRYNPDSGKDVSVQVLDTPRKQDFRLRKISTTEVSRSWNREHSSGADEVSDKHADTEWIPAVFKRWDATLDAKVCAECRSHDGDITPAGFDYEGGDSPGDMHPNCRCIDTLIFIPMPISKSNQEAA